MTPSPSSLELQDVSLACPTSGAPPILSGVSLRLVSGEVCVVLGRNGAGKSSLLRVASGTLPPTAGTVSLGNVELRRLSVDERARRIAVVEQRSEVPEGFRVADVVQWGLWSQRRSSRPDTSSPPAPSDDTRVRDVMDRLGLGDKGDRWMSELSGGEQRLVTVARALVQAREVLLLDEATTHLDPHHVRVVHAEVGRRVREEGLACLAVLHDLNSAAGFGDRFLVLDRGRVIDAGPADAILGEAPLERAFGIPFEVGRTPSGKRWVVPA